MKPDFTKTVIETLAKRAAFLCSNPDCRINTVGPNTEPSKALSIGEAAHILGAREGSSRYDPAMTDAARAEITNAIWLCRNCHKIVDADESKFTKELLFAWRETHESHVLSELGTQSDRIRVAQQQEIIEPFEKYPHIIKRIVLDKPPVWEFRLTAELMRFLNYDSLKRIEDLRAGRYVRPIAHIERKDAKKWIDSRLDEMMRMIAPVQPLLDAMQKSWGALGEPGNELDILHVCKRVSEYLHQVLVHEEQFYFAALPMEFEGVLELLKDRVGSQVTKLSELPDYLDDLVLRATNEGSKESPLIIEKEIKFDVPDDWAEKFNKAYSRAVKGELPSKPRILQREFSIWWLALFAFVGWLLFGE